MPAIKLIMDQKQYFYGHVMNMFVFKFDEFRSRCKTSCTHPACCNFDGIWCCKPTHRYSQCYIYLLYVFCFLGNKNLLVCNIVISFYFLCIVILYHELIFLYGHRVSRYPTINKYYYI